MSRRSDSELGNRSVSIGIVGAGEIVTSVHLPVLKNLQGASVVWITDADRGKARSLAKCYQTPICELPDDLTQLPAADVVLLAIPFGAREPYYSALRERGCALYVEKPFSKNVQHHEMLCSWFPSHKLACGFHRRSWGPTLQIRDAVNTDLFGELRAINYGFGGPGVVVGGKYNADLNLAGGGILFETAVHGIDALLFCSSGSEVSFDRVSMISDDGFDLHTNAEFIIRTRRGQRIDCQMTVSCLEETSQQLEFFFDRAVVSYSLFGEGTISIRPVNGRGYFTMFGGSPLTTYQTVYNHWNRFLDDMRAGKAGWTSASQSLLTTAVLERLYDLSDQSVVPEAVLTQCQ
jgi:predicted dehydrogenase